MKEVIILSGLPASGKSTEARRWVAEDPANRERINYDDIRKVIIGDQKWTLEQEKHVKEVAKLNALRALVDGKSIIIDNTNLTPRARQTWKSLAASNGAEWVEQDIDTPVAECVRRDSNRKGKDRVGQAVIDRMALWNGYIDWEDKSQYWSQEFVIFDVDGTLTDTSHREHLVRQSPKQWDAFFSACDKDTPNNRIVEMAKLISNHYNILVVSGRPIDLCGVKTEDWLHRHFIPYRHLFMRQGGDFRPDNVVKQEILDFLPKNRIAWVFDDRDQVVKMWRDNGLTCCQVGYGAF